jgi:CelD/BcsL family acetyltransferase involved in cellulose biosynthesis
MTPAKAAVLTPLRAGPRPTIVDARRPQLGRDLGAHQLGSLFSSPPWIEALARTYGFEIQAVTAGGGGRAESALLFAHVADLRGERVLSLPFSDYCDPLVDDLATWEALVEPLLAYEAPIRLRCLRNPIPLGDSRFAPVKRALWHGVDLDRDEAELWAGLGGSARQNVRRALRHGVVVREGRALEDVRLFHRLHARLRKAKYRMLAQPVAFFDHLFELFAPDDRLTVLLAEVAGEPVAGILLLQWGGTLYYKFNASTDQHVRPNDLLMWHAIRLGRRLGCTLLDLGISDLDQPGLIRYKSKYATQAKEVVFLEWLPQRRPDPRADQASRLLARLTSLLTEPTVPDEVTEAGGDELYRFFC